MKKWVANTVMDIPEPEFRAGWVAILWRAMGTLARGFRMWTLKNQPPRGASHWRGERRKDKEEGSTKLSRRIAMRMQIA